MIFEHSLWGVIIRHLYRYVCLRGICVCVLLAFEFVFPDWPPPPVDSVNHHEATYGIDVSPRCPVGSLDGRCSFSSSAVPVFVVSWLLWTRRCLYSSGE